MNEFNETEVDVDQLMARIREAADARRAAPQNGAAHTSGGGESDGSSSPTQLEMRPFVSQLSLPTARRGGGGGDGGAAAAAAAAAAFPQLILEPEFRPAADDRYHLNDLLKYHDRVFIRNAYRAVLKREPDETGARQQLDFLRSGRYDKIDILAGLRASPEGRMRGVEIDGLVRPAVLRRLGRLPLFGYALRLAYAVARLPVLLREQRQFEAHAAAQHQQIADFINQDLGESFDGRIGRLEASLEAVQQDVTHINRRLEALTQSREQIEGALDQLRGDHKRDREEIYARLAEGPERIKKLAEALTQSTEERVKSLAQRLQQTRAELVLQERRVSLLLEEARKRLPARLDPDQLQVMAGEENRLFDGLYTLFEDQFRGSRADIKERLKVYLPFVQKAAGAGDILDLGCGRGEWLEVLRDAQLEGRGVDLNRVMIEQCRERQLVVTEGDAIAHLRTIGDDSLRVVTAFHFAEHLAFKALVGLLDEVMRTLRPGGLVILETPNPENLVVGSCNFYLDPDHRKPLPSAMMRFLLESRGFCRVEVIGLNPNDSARLDGTSELIRRFNELMYGPLDYAVIGWKV